MIFRYAILLFRYLTQDHTIVCVFACVCQGFMHMGMCQVWLSSSGEYLQKSGTSVQGYYEYYAYKHIHTLKGNFKFEIKNKGLKVQFKIQE